ncbi:MAG: acryloyl-CoA reductase [Magnetococcales bacterium]|nr:acryloyl-CoA reductase [Magnetococcales bacterium]
MNEANEVLLLERDNAGVVHPRITFFPVEELPAGDVVVRVIRSGINYKDALAVSGKGVIIRRFPMIPGIDLAGEVVSSDHPAWRIGDRVLSTGRGMGETRHGAFARFTRLPGEWLTALPEGWDADRAMLLGTAGLTAMLTVMALEAGDVLPERGAVLVTGPTGGVGGWAVVLLAQLGYRVCAATGRMSHEGYLRELGASEVIDRAELTASSKPLDLQRWSGAVDVAGGATLAGMLKHITYGGTVAACGLADDATLPASVFPFILRSIRLQGVDSVMIDATTRQTAWNRLAEIIPETLFDRFRDRTVSLTQTPHACEDLLAGRARGRILVDPHLSAP